MLVVDQELEDKLRDQEHLIRENDVLDVVAKVTHPLVNWTWYLITYSEQDDNAIYSILDGDEVEYGYVGLEEIMTHKIKGIPFEIEHDFEPINAEKLYKKLVKKKKL